MKTSAKIMAALLALVLGLCIMPAQAATLPPSFDTSVLTELQNELNDFGTDHAKQISNALLDKAGVEQDGSAYTKKVNLFGKETTIFFMYGHKKNDPNVPVSVVAVMVPMDLTTKALFGDSVPSLGLKNPVVCYAKEDCDLLTADMPARTQPSLKSIMPNQVIAAKGLNFFGTLTSSIEDFPYALPSELFAGFATGKNEKGQKKYTINAAISKPWNNPLGLQSTTMKDGMFRIRKEGEVKTTEVWGTASVGSPKEYTLYYKQEGALQQSLAFDTNEAELKDFFSILDALGMPFEAAKKSLPLTIVQLSNPNYKPQLDASALPDFAKMMFKVTRTSTGIFTELIANAEGSLLKQKMASLTLNASAAKKSVQGRATVNAKLGPLDAASANFHLDAALTGVPTMGLTVKSGVLGNLELAASGDGLKLDVPADCPLRPIGFTASITDLTLTDFPITPDLKDCYSKEIVKVFNGTVDIAGDVGETVAKGAAETAKGLADEAKKNYERLQVDRVGALSKALTNHAVAKDAANAASNAYNTATNAVSACTNRITNLDNDIRSLAKDIDKLLQKVWAFVSGQVKSKRAEKSKKESERDRERVARAAAERRQKQAGEALEKAKKGMDDSPGPNFDPTVAQANEQLLGELAQQEVQAQVAAYAETELPKKFKSQEERKKMLQALKSDEFLAEQEEAIKAAYPNLSLLITKEADGKMPVERLLDEAKTALVVKAVSKDIEAKTEALLKQTVPTLPTMAFEVPVNLVYGEGSDARCLGALEKDWKLTYNGANRLAPCTGAPSQTFKFRAGGDWVSGTSHMILFSNGETGWQRLEPDQRSGGMIAVLAKSMANAGLDMTIQASRLQGKKFYSAKNFFFDPLGGFFTTYSTELLSVTEAGSDPAKVIFLTATKDGVLIWSGEPPSKEAPKWRMVPAGQAKNSTTPKAASVMKVPGGKEVGVKPPVISPAATNLAPLRLD